MIYRRILSRLHIVSLPRTPTYRHGSKVEAARSGTQTQRREKVRTTSPHHHRPIRPHT